jgi:phosphoribosylformylglycinamidine cyclo-ligase
MLYKEAGVDIEKEEYILASFKKRLRKSFPFLSEEKIKLGLDYFANVIEIDSNFGLALCCDGVGTKILVAEKINKFDTLGIDCVAMNVNDLVCVGAIPLALLDYIALNKLDPYIIEELGKGLYRGAKEANIAIIGGETAQLKDMLSSLDIVGFGIGSIKLDSIITGNNIKEGDILLGLSSSGIHSNGLSLARLICFQKKKLKENKYIPELRRSIAEELLEPTKIYSNFIVKLLSLDEIEIRGLAHITGGGLLNLLRFTKKISFRIDSLPPSPPIFSLLKEWGDIPTSEMFRVFNMGIGFCLVIKDNSSCIKKIKELAKNFKIDVFVLGYAIENNKKELYLQPLNLVGRKNRFLKE